MATLLYRWMFKFVGVWSLYQEVVVQDRLTNIRPQIRADLTRLLEKVDVDNPYFRGQFTQFLAENRNTSDDAFFANYSKLPSRSKDDYANAGQQVMTEELSDVDPKTRELQVEGRPLESLRRLRQGGCLPLTSDH